jgi:phosphopantetheinyl transferase (holo-ACP synthase)
LNQNRIGLVLALLQPSVEFFFAIMRGSASSCGALPSRVLGVGVDIALVPRIAATLHRFGTRFLLRAFHPNEVAAAASLAPDALPAYFAARWAAKEALHKALASQRLLFPDIEVARRGGDLGAAAASGGSMAPAAIPLLRGESWPSERGRPDKLSDGGQDADWWAAAVGPELALPAYGPKSGCITSPDTATAHEARLAERAARPGGAYPSGESPVAGAEAARGGTAPRIRLHGGAAAAVAALGGGAIHVALSHDGDYAMAAVLVERARPSAGDGVGDGEAAGAQMR